MLAYTADWFAPGDAQGLRTTTGVQHLPQGKYAFSPPNILLGAALLLVVLWATHQLGTRRSK